jgi:spore germination cell wall hydrolase CwlJ-like protein
MAVSTVIDNGVRIRQMNKALFYHADYVNPFWRDNKKMIGQIGSHIFYWGGKNSWIEL